VPGRDTSPGATTGRQSLARQYAQHPLGDQHRGTAKTELAFKKRTTLLCPQKCHPNKQHEHTKDIIISNLFREKGETMATSRYHVVIDEARTTVTLAPVLSELLILKLGAEPGTEAGHGAVRQWLQAEIEKDPGAVRYGRASQRLAYQAILAIAAPSLIAKREAWQYHQNG
jgi:hypothetical protein